MKSILVLIGLGICVGAQAQEWTFGPKVNLGLSARQPLEEVVVGTIRATVGGSSGDASTSGVGAFARYDRLRWYGQAEVNRLRSQQLSASITTTTLGFTTAQPRNRSNRTDVRIVGGYKLLPWLRASVGLGAVHHDANPADAYQHLIASAEQQAVQFPEAKDQFLSQARAYEVAQVIQNGLQRQWLEASLGLGIDIGGLTADLVHTNTLTPLINGIVVRDRTYALRQQATFWSLQLGYRLFPLKAHLLAPRKNRAYERIKRDIPFYRNEFHLSGGLLGEDIGSAFLYENRYTHYLTRRAGITAGLNLMRINETYVNGFLPKQYTQVQLVTGFRVLPLYSRRHTIGLTAGPLFIYETGFRTNSGGTRTMNGQLVQTVDFSASSRAQGLSVAVQGTIDYNFAATDRLILGPWLRATPDYGYLGVQAGYRF
ncbi:hypothetical protein [Spirosoma sp. 209]|uniref:hypothetical protein n=1 Tax=Spirosoma sp. 209 TaxID=1955701 RepID=UPI00098CFEE1|nr:hypothetical protein [Spirosoma sp. 209]